MPKRIAIALIFALLAVSARASLTITVTPGVVLTTNTPITYDNLNLLGMPVLTVSGTIGGGTNGGIAPNSISGTEMLDSFPDGGTLGLPAGLATMGWNTANPRQLSVNTPGLCDGLGGIYGRNTNALGLLVDPVFFLLSTNTVGGTNGGNTGSTGTNWLTLVPHSLSDLNLATGGVSSVSITTNGLNPSSINGQEIWTNIFVISGGFATNTTTNLNTVFVGNTNGLGVAVALGAGLAVSNVPTVVSFATNTGTYFVTNLVPTLEAPAFNGSLPLLANLGPWTNNLGLPGSQAYTTNVTGTNFPFSAYNAGGTAPYTNIWTSGVQALSGPSVNFSYITNLAGGGTNSSTVMLVTSLNFSGGNQFAIFWISNTVYDSTGQRATVALPAYINLHHP